LYASFSNFGGEEVEETKAIKRVIKDEKKKKWNIKKMNERYSSIS